MDKKDFNNNIGVWKELFDLDDKSIGALYADIVKRNVNFDNRLLLTVKPWFVRLATLIENIIVPKNQKRFNSKENDFIFVTCLDPIHRVKTLSLIAGNLKFTKFFLPSITRPMIAKKYSKFYRNHTSERVYFGLFSSDDIKNYIQFLKRHKNLFKSIKCEKGSNAKELRYYLMRFALYRIYTARIFSEIDKKCLWLFEHDKFFFIPIIEHFHRKNVTTIQLQHGTFFNYKTAVFIPLYTDKILCCSKREKLLYIESGIKEIDIYVIGAPLQSIETKKFKDIEIKYDVLILLTSTSIAFDIMRTTLKYIKQYYADKKILLRFRPRSNKQDKALLSDLLDGFSISEGTSLTEDIYSCKRVISFSEDANFEVIKAKKKFVCIVDSSCLFKYLEGICYTIDNIKESLNLLMNNDNEILMEQYVENYGETDISKISQNFIYAITNLKSLL